MSDSNNGASIGCGTLILIALIVLIFGNNNDDQIKELRSLRAEVRQLSREVRQLRSADQDGHVERRAEAPDESTP